MSLRLFSIFTKLTVIIAVPAVYPVPNPVAHGAGVIHTSIVGMENIKLTDSRSLTVNIVRLGCGTCALYYANLTVAFSNAAVVPINASVLVCTKYKESGVIVSETPIPSRSPSISRDSSRPCSSLPRSPVLPEVSLSGAIIHASNATLTFSVPRTISLLKLVTGGG